MPDLIFALVRTIASLIVGAVLTALANLARQHLGVELVVDDFTKVTLISGTTALISMLWYATFATLERRWPAFGIFLGWPKAPRYGPEEPPQELPAARSPLDAPRRTHEGDGTA